jgi:hypothetical protein
MLPPRIQAEIWYSPEQKKEPISKIQANTSSSPISTILFTTRFVRMSFALTSIEPVFLRCGETKDFGNDA